VLEGNFLFAIITSVGHTITLYLKLGGSLWTNESRLDTKDEWIDVAEFNVIVTPVKSVETNINI
jgi:hypothetical protein